MTAAVVIPAWNEELTIAGVVEAVRTLGVAVVVDDGSADGTAAAARGAGAQVVVHPVNRGYDAALATGLRAGVTGGFDVVLTVDADGEQVLDALQEAVGAVERGEVTFAIGVRDAPARISERAFSFYTRHRFGVSDILCGVKVYRATFVAEHDAVLDRATIGTGLALAGLRTGAPFTTFPVPVRPQRPSRFGGGLRANAKIGRAMADAIASDLRRGISPRSGRRTRSTSS